MTTMLMYYLSLAIQSLRRGKIFTLLVVIAIGLGVGASMTMITVVHAMSGDPLPNRSSVLFYPHLDPLPSSYSDTNEGISPNRNFTWPDAMALLHAKRAKRQAVMAGASAIVYPDRSNKLPFSSNGHYVTSDFFEMFGVSFVYGSHWSENDDDAHARLVVLAHSMAHKIFGTSNPVGRELRIGPTSFRIVGVVTGWNPQPMFYADSSAKVFGDPDEFFLPLSTAVELKMDVNGHFATWKQQQPADKRTSADDTWLQVWVELASSSDVEGFKTFLHNYAAQQHANGRFERSPDRSDLLSMNQLLKAEKLIPDNIKMELWLAIAFLIVCVTNISALLLAKFLRRRQEISIRRALGAKRGGIIVQLSVEAATIGVFGGLLGIALAAIGVWLVRLGSPNSMNMVHMDLWSACMAAALAIFSALVAGVIPAWRASTIAPALQMKAS